MSSSIFTLLNRSTRVAALLFLALQGTGPCVAETVCQLSALDLKQVTAGWSVAKRDQGILGRPLSLRGVVFANGVGTHASSRMRVDLGGRALRFQSTVGIDDSAGGKGSAEFLLEGDGKVLWRSGTMTGASPAKTLDVALRAIKTLVLTVTDAGDGAGDDHADWADARIVMADGAPPPHCLEPFETIRPSAGSFVLKLEVREDGRLYQLPIGATTEANRPDRADESYPQSGDGFVWEPALEVAHSDGNTSTRLLYAGSSVEDAGSGRKLFKIMLKDPAYPFNTTLCFRSNPEEEVLEEWTEIRHGESGAVQLHRMASSSLVFAAGTGNIHLTHFHGDWADEMHPFTEPLTPGTKVLDSKLGVRAHQFQNPSFLLSLDGPLDEASGRVLAGSLAWSGSFQCAFDHTGKRVRALCGVNPYSSAYALAPNETFVTPTMIWGWSDAGAGPMSRKLHAWARKFGFRDGGAPRSVLLNNWEATGFDFDFARIAGLFAPAKQLGVELFLLDDGWFGNKYPRVNDNAGLGDWEPNRRRLPNGLEPLAKEAVRTGLQFGIWIEPEMVNPKSELFEKHPNWAIRQPKRDLELQRNQLTLDLSRPEVRKFEWSVIQRTLSVPGTSYAKWDCNRYLTQPGSSWLAPDRQSHLWIDYVRALYELMDRTAREFPQTELMLCSGGGGRVDYGALRYFHEFWPSDNTDPVRRVLMQWDYSYFFPAMTMASHVTHWGNRPMHFACSVAMSGRFGMDLDLAKLSDQDKAICAGAINAYKRVRDVTHLGQLYRLERPHDAPRGAINFVAADRSRAVLFVFRLKDGPGSPVRPQGLDPLRNYTVRELNPMPGRPSIPEEGRTMTGAELMRVGLSPSCARALEACVVELGS